MSLTRAPHVRTRARAWPSAQLSQLTSRARVTFKNLIVSCVHLRVAKTMASSTASTGSFQNQQPSSGNQQPSTSSFQNQQPPKKTRKRGIAALMDKTNQVCEQSHPQRLCKENARARVATQLTPSFEERGDPAKGGKAHAKIVQCKDSQEGTLYSVFTKNKALFNQGKEFVSKYVSRNISWEVQKAIAIQTMTTAMTELRMGVVQAANFAGTLTGFSGQVVRRWASALFVTLAQYPGSLDDVDNSFIELELSSERGKACGNPTAIIHDEEFCLAAREHIRSNAYRENQILQLICFVPG